MGALNVKKASKLKASWMNACYLRMFNYNWLNNLCKCMTSLMACTISREFSELKLIHFNEETENIYKQKKLSVWTKKIRKMFILRKRNKATIILEFSIVEKIEKISPKSLRENRRLIDCSWNNKWDFV